MSKAARSDLAADRARALALTPVSRETLARLDRFVELLLTWQETTNLIAPSTIPHLWTRHIADSLQLLELAPTHGSGSTSGSGGGFPGLVIACALAERPGAVVHLVESNAKKAAFLREAAATHRRAGNGPRRAHRAIRRTIFAEPVDVVTARALAPLPALLGLSSPLLARKGVQGLVPEGPGCRSGIADAAKSWMMDATLVPSRTDPHGRIVVSESVAAAPELEPSHRPRRMRNERNR